ncbi:binding-protein-dependent transport systems inner membrane component [Beutenbergia cavernae DSM 12333]|uniref:Binding-protein-dependent transport systems inner membrane component n=1 Tax=Beutenbergia cavernae (strain ATCC BAA-8 / DSM 12333 / CCUG 43141 / JCM 11478 / NBRC 16432 / NCIMB 13614 / HKI 0122) TaxID=471853 RepID=C5BXN1_BEUC1|nr:ABC transporter permease [Beutenbergia cavernae]ACQ80914.1 binding-protein-dependent transport systems inner membrane component [Beutenbergia cavernae DSM 12333]
MLLADAASVPANPWVSWTYVQNNSEEIARALGQHVSMTLQAVLVALVIAIPLALAARFRPRLAGAILGTTAVLYTIPSLALFILLVPFTGASRTTVVIGLVLYALLLLVRNILAGLRDVPAELRDAARGQGMDSRQLLLRVDAPLATPAVVTGLRLTTVSTIALVTVGVAVGHGGLGQLMFRGFASNYRAQVFTATALCLLLAFAADLLLWLLGRALTPWTRSRSGPVRQAVAA